MVVLVSNMLIHYLVISCSQCSVADGMRQMFDPFEQTARVLHKCPCCERPFSPEEEDDFVKKVCFLLFITVYLCNLLS